MKLMIKQPWKKGSATEPGSLPGKGDSASNVILAGARTGSRLDERINPKWAGYYRTLIALRERLLRERDDLVKAASEPLESFSMDMADAATDQFDHDLVLSRLSSEPDALYEVDGAIKRILDGSYGMCEQTGQPISQARLRAIPWTRFARAVEERLEKKAVLTGPRLGQVRSVRGAATGNLEGIEPVEEGADEDMANDEALEQVFSPSVKSEPSRAAGQTKGNRTLR